MKGMKDGTKAAQGWGQPDTTVGLIMDDEKCGGGVLLNLIRPAILD